MFYKLTLFYTLLFKNKTKKNTPFTPRYKRNNNLIMYLFNDFSSLSYIYFDLLNIQSANHNK